MPLKFVPVEATGEHAGALEQPVCLQALKVGGTSYVVGLAEETGPHEAYRQESGSLKFLGHVTHRIDLKRNFAQIDSERVKSRTEEAVRGRHARTYELACSHVLTDRVIPLEGASGKNGFGRTLSLPPMRSAPSSPFLAAIGSPRIRPSPAPSPRGSPLIHQSNHSGTSSVPNGTLRKRLVQLLAFGPASEAELIRRTRGPSIETGGILAEIAVRKKKTGSEWELKDASWTEVKVWDPKYFSPRQREQIVKMAMSAFDRLGLPDDAKERRALLKKEEAESLDVAHPTLSNGSHLLATEDSKIIERTVTDLRVGQSVVKKRRNPPYPFDSEQTEPVAKRQKPTSPNEATQQIGLGISNVKPSRKHARKSSRESLLKKPSPLGSSPVNSERSVSVAPSPLPNEIEVQVTDKAESPKGMSAGEDSLAPADLIVLAKKFKAQHAIYAQLYNQLKTSKIERNNGKHQEQYLQLMRMHDELGRWKSMLYAAV